MKKILIISLLPFFVVGCEKVDQLQRRANASEQDIKELYREIGELKTKVENCSRPVVDTGSRKASASVSKVDAELKKIKASILNLENAQQFCVQESVLIELKARLVKIEKEIYGKQFSQNNVVSKADVEKIKESISKIEYSLKELSSKVREVESKLQGVDVRVCYGETMEYDFSGLGIKMKCNCKGYLNTNGYGAECESCGHKKSEHTRAIKTL